MKNSISFDQCRRGLRRELFIARQLARDNSEVRLYQDAQKLDAQLEAKGYQLPYKTEWGKCRLTKTFSNATKSHQQIAITDFNHGEVDYV